MKGVPPATAKFTQIPTTKVFTDDGREVQPGSDEIGMVAAGGNVPLGYYKDPEKSARTFRVIDGVRYSFPGDMAQVAADGTLILLGRGSQVINTGGEKIFPEEVEEAVEARAGVATASSSASTTSGSARPSPPSSSLADGADARRGRRDRRRQGAARRLQGAEARRVRRRRCRAPPTARPTTARPANRPCPRPDAVAPDRPPSL